VTGRALRWLLPAALLLLVALGTWYYVMGTPQYSLYRLGAALRDHDAPGVERFVDIDRVAQAASEAMAADYLEHEPRATQVLEALGQGSARATAARALKPFVAQRVRAEIDRMAREGGAGRGALTLPVGLAAGFWGLNVQREPPDAWIIYQQPGRTQTRFRMSQQPDRSWKITELDREWIRRQVRAPVLR